MAWTALTFSFASKLTSLKMTQLQTNFTALGDGATGAPKVKNPGRDFTTATLTAGSQSIAGLGNYVLPAGLYIVSTQTGGTGFHIELNDSGWSSIGGSSGAMVYSDGANIRVVNDDASNATFNYFTVT